MLTIFFLYSELGSDGSEYEQLSTPEDSEEADDDHDFDVDGMLLYAYSNIRCQLLAAMHDRSS